ncbi:SMI1/KNR4 family protein [Brooklawnia cerclae]|uniref:Cell wall assembly regulator SMI1 n=1 Tax=Brooklawnia cerclae TaxID=349934 RepID=A0ABX0SE45_9ACTN|nr:SMI1/KNR4 family protein [Brooklawnia cerclae]NIH55500.1 cell wall assembly regulator SMI1 [Brooklawnia cerclae]
MTATSIPAHLATVEDGIRRLRRDILLRNLQPGLSAETIRTTLASVDLPSAPELEALYGWHDGTATPPGVKLGSIYLLPGYYLLSLEDAVANYKAFVGDRRWTTGWLPVFADGGGDFYVVDFTAPSPNPVRLFWIDEDEAPIEFGSITAMLNTIGQGYERGVFVNDEHGYLEMDSLDFEKVAAELNPDIKWWTEDV